MCKNVKGWGASVGTKFRVEMKLAVKMIIKNNMPSLLIIS